MTRLERLWVCAWLVLALVGVIGWMWQQHVEARVGTVLSPFA